MMNQAGTVRMVVPIAIAILGAVGLLAFQTCACDAPALATGEAEWRSHLAAVDEALTTRNVSHAVRAWQDARAAAVRAGSWEAMIHLGDAYLRIGEVAAVRNAARARAREMYLLAFFRAQVQRSLEGVLHATEAFAALGDEDVVERGLRVAAQLCVLEGPAAGQRVSEVATRLGARRTAGLGADVF